MAIINTAPRSAAGAESHPSAAGLSPLGAARPEDDRVSRRIGLSAVTGLTGLTGSASVAGNRTPRGESAAEWRLLAECGPQDTELFYSKDTVERRAAIAICRDCPVSRECLAEALAQEGGVDLHGRYGIRGGLTPSERREVARAWKAGTAKSRSSRAKRATAG